MENHFIAIEHSNINNVKSLWYFVMKLKLKFRSV